MPLNQNQLNRLDVAIRDLDNDPFGQFIRGLFLGETSLEQPDMQGVYKTVLDKLSTWLIAKINSAEMARKMERERI